uniref:Ceramide phosphoethanolamine synthase n=1 Tax=Strigamia maritima TaxID=126957 RepID=T1JBG1_STRMM
MSTLMEHKGALLGVFFILLYFMWMDVALYYHIQGREPPQPSSEKPVYHSRSGLQGLFSPFNGLSIKMMMIDPANHYIHTPAATIFNEVTHFSSVFSFITPNMISVSHVFVAIIAVKFIASDTLLMRQVGVLLFEFRSFLDCLDGVLARVRNKQESNISEFGSMGYVVDGVADTLGSAALIIGCFLYLRRNQPSRRSMGKLSLASVESAIVGSSASSQRRILTVLGCFSLQLFISAFFWDRYISGYHQLLENPQASEQQMVELICLRILQNEVLKSALMWIIMWFWRIANAHALLEMVLFSIFINKLWEFLAFIQFIGFICLFVLISLTEVHFHDVTNYIGKLALTSKLLSAQPT